MRENWFPCHRDENILSIVSIEGQPFKAAKLVVKPRTDFELFGLGRRHSECRQEDAIDYPRTKYDERAELWESDNRLLRFGTEVWYRFAMYIDPTIPESGGNRLVIGQWKEDGGHSPMIAQRFVNRRFTITLQQDNDAPDRVPEDDECRILVAHDDRFMIPVDPGSASLAASSAFRTAGGRAVPRSVGHDRFETVNAVSGQPHPCARDIKVTAHANLPNVFGGWTTMLYRIKATADDTGLLEIWANGKPIVSVAGRIGFRDHKSDMQYFKFGPYRDRATYETYALFAKFERSLTRLPD